MVFKRAFFPFLKIGGKDRCFRGRAGRALHISYQPGKMWGFWQNGRRVGNLAAKEAQKCRAVLSNFCPNFYSQLQKFGLKLKMEFDREPNKNTNRLNAQSMYSRVSGCTDFIQTHFSITYRHQTGFFVFFLYKKNAAKKYKISCKKKRTFFIFFSILNL